MTRGAALTLAVAVLGASGCVHARDFRSPYERITPNTAYAEGRRGRTDVDLLVPGAQTLGVNVGVTVAPLPRRLDLTLNLAHGAAGIVSAQSKFTVYDGAWYALGGRVGLTYINPRALWFLPAGLRRELGTFHLASVPLELWNSFPLTRWFGLHLGLSYRATVLAGSFDGDALLADASFSRRGFTAQPVLDVYIAQRLAIRAGATVPLDVRYAEATSVEYELDDDIIVGARSVEWIRGEFVDNLRLWASLETRFGYNTHLALGVHVWGFRFLDILAVTPSLSLYWRF